MNEDALQGILKRGPHIVVEIISGFVEIGNFQAIVGKQKWIGAVQFAALELPGIIAQFDRQAPKRPAFTLKEISEIANENAPTINAWIKDRVITPSIRDREGRGTAMLFSRADAFVVCVVASFKRQCRLKNETLRKVAMALGNGPMSMDDEKERCTRPKKSARQ